MKTLSSCFAAVLFMLGCDHSKAKRDWRSEFVCKWAAFSVQMEQEASLPLGIYLDRDQDTSDCSSRGFTLDSVHIKTIMGESYEGLVYWKEEQLVCLLDSTRQEVLLFDFAMRPGDTAYIRFPDEPSGLYNETNRAPEGYALILEWKLWDSCLRDTIYMFRYDHGQYAYSNPGRSEEYARRMILDLEYYKDEVFFAGKESGMLGYVRGQHLITDGKVVQEINNLYGRFYINCIENAQDLIFHQYKIQQDYLESNNYCTCLNGR
ncbi:MAG: hypothetical protein NW241_14390 [Bacteroidia bacterium]|nr:hypothetical protein [Bacteroidia bacterium]